MTICHNFINFAMLQSNEHTIKDLMGGVDI